MGSAYPPQPLLHSIACRMGRPAKRSTPWAGHNRLCTPMLVSHASFNGNTWPNLFCMIFWHPQCMGIATRHSAVQQRVLSDVAKWAAALFPSAQKALLEGTGNINHCLDAVSGLRRCFTPASFHSCLELGCLERRANPVTNFRKHT